MAEANLAPSIAERDAPAMLATLGATSPAERFGVLLGWGDPAGSLGRLIAESERLAVVDVTQAIGAAELTVALADAAAVPAARVLARRALMQALAHAGRFGDVVPIGEEAVRIGEGHDLPVATARARLATVQVLANLGKFDDAIAAAEAAWGALTGQGETALAARADLNLGAVYQMRDDPATALRHYDRARGGLLAEPVSLAQLEVNRGNALMSLDDFAGAEVAFSAAILAFEDGGLEWATAVAHENLAYLSLRQGRLEAALRHFELGRRRLEADDSPAVLARLMAEQAVAQAALGLLEEASACFDEVLPRLAELGLSYEEAQARAGLGRVLLRLGRVEAARAQLDMAAGLLDALGHPTARAQLDLVRAELMVHSGQLDPARELASGALAVLGKRPADAVIARLALARIALAKGELRTARRELDAAMPAAEALDLAPLLAELRHQRGLLHRLAGHHEKAAADLRIAVQQVERLRGSLQAERFRVAFLGDRVGVYEDLVRQVLDLDGATAIAEAFAVVEQAKGRALLDIVGGALNLPNTPESNGDRSEAEARLLAEADSVRAELNWHVSGLVEQVSGAGQAGSGSADEHERSETMRRLERELDSLQDRLASTAAHGGLYAAPIGLLRAQVLIPDGTALIEYFQAGDELIAFVVSAEAVRVVRGLAPAASVADRVRRFHFQIGRAIRAGAEASQVVADRLLGDVRRELAALHEGVFAPVEAVIGDATRLLIVPHGALHTLPFQALWDGRRHLIDGYEMHYVPSASLLDHLPWRARAGGEAGPLVVGVPDALAPQIANEVARVSATLRSRRTLVGAGATTDRVMSEAATADVIHLACHGRFSAHSPLRSGLKLADGWLTVRDIYGMRLRADLVTLSGCDTGRAVVGGGDELVGLQRGFFAAGASSLLLSLWTVNDASTADLMTEFYARWQAGSAKATALRAAQLTGLQQRPHPAFWAPFTLGGNA